ncbi:uncharacterized protein EV420DRAFT_1575331 [Desarmillaria tabescens]|uniref:MYND-type domain-containing protein n=1 Tax=Armillaria tabescens TaxID=1929756 RepID=A0AA39JNY1_ARMTA|nr:uncharacterized protein EV420DRAFT_1575331 [Desarmillaria tabescens]KAK0443908.1 hypothetical protein EV420DRAFT_1575331 [Desarmillaria tabescens]
MAQAVLWPKKTFFYPIGNTSPISLTQDHPPDIPADILLLGCGDPRNILYTLYSDLRCGASHRRFDVTCCDIEPAILARNILLFTLLVDTKADNIEIWNIFYHFYLDNASIQRLWDQCSTLVRASQSLESWQNSPYSSAIRMCTDHTLQVLHNQWALYLNTKSMSEGERARRKKQFCFEAESIAQREHSISPCWSAGPDVTTEHFKNFWHTGVMMSETHSTSLPHMNPTFLYSLQGDTFNVHYATDPIRAFHPRLVRRTGPPTMESVIRAAKTQFSQWSQAFRDTVAEGAIILRFFNGDALALCDALQELRRSGTTLTSVGTSYWTGTPPSCYNVIDTSNLSDHLGDMNILAGTVPLLRKDQFSALRTQTLLSKSLGRSLPQSFVERFCGDVSTLSLLLGVAPVSYITRYSTRYIPQDSAKSIIPDISPVTEGDLIWKRTDLDFSPSDRRNPRLVVDPQELSRYLFGVYLKITWRMHSGFFYARPSFVAVLKVVKDRVETNWTVTMEQLFDLIALDKKLFTGLNFYQDLCSELHRQGVYSVETLSSAVSIESAKDGIFRHWVDPIPPLVSNFNKVPDDIGTPVLQLELQSRMAHFHNSFSFIQLVFGTLSIEGDLKDPWSGASDLILTLWVPAWILCVSPKTTDVMFSFRSTPSNKYIAKLMRQLGSLLTIFKTKLLDDQHVFFSRRYPSFSDASLTSSSPGLEQVVPISDATSDSQPVLVKASLNPDNVTTLSIRTDVVDTNARQALLKGHGWYFQFDDFCHSVVFPYPIDGAKIKLRIARKSVLPVSNPKVLDSLSFNYVPVPMLEVPWVWSMHYPLLAWLRQHISLIFSERECRLRDLSAAQRDDALLAIKDTFFTLYTDLPQIVIFLRHLRLDLASHTVVIDCFVLPITKRVDWALEVLNRKPMLIIKTHSAEIKAWKQMLPAITERCRTWSHTDNCEYLTRRIPVSLEDFETPLCSCGLGHGVGSYFKDAGLDKKFCNYVTTAAISPLFALSFLESMGRSQIRCAAQDCGKKEGLRLCARCRTVSYCSALCQKSDWKRHKVVCKKE